MTLPAGTRYLTDSELAARRAELRAPPRARGHSKNGLARGARRIRRGLPPLDIRPGRQVQYARSHRTGSVLFLFALLVAVDAMRRGFPKTPGAITLQRSLGYAGAAIGFMVLASFAPGFATTFVGGVLVISALRAAPQLAAFGDSVAARIRTGAAAGGAGSPVLVR